MSGDKPEELNGQQAAKESAASDSEAVQEVTEESATTHEDAARLIVHNYTLASLAPALFPVPLVDLAMLTGIQLKMLQALSEHYQQDFSTNMSRTAMNALISSVFPVALKPALASMLKFIPVAGQVSGMASMLILGAAATYALGNVFVRHFSTGGTLESFDAKAVQSYFMEEFEKGKVVAANLKQQANTYSETLRHPEEEKSERK